MRYIVASVGGLLVTGGAFAGIMMLAVALHSDVFETSPGLVAMYIIATPIAILAGVSSFRATVRHYGKQDFSATTPLGVSASKRSPDDIAAKWKSADEKRRASATSVPSEALQDVKVNVQPKGTSQNLTTSESASEMKPEPGRAADWPRE
jgi:hypothetical protein